MLYTHWRDETSELLGGCDTFKERYLQVYILVLLRFAKKSPTLSLEVDIDVGLPNIDVGHCRKNTEKLRNYLKHRNGRPLFIKFELKEIERSQ